MEPTQERLRAEWRAIYRGWQRGHCEKTRDSPTLRLARKYKISCQEVKRILDRPTGPWGGHKPERFWLDEMPYFLRHDGRHEIP